MDFFISLLYSNTSQIKNTQKSSLKINLKCTDRVHVLVVRHYYIMISPQLYIVKMKIILLLTLLTITIPSAYALEGFNENAVNYMENHLDTLEKYETKLFEWFDEFEEELLDSSPKVFDTYTENGRMHEFVKTGESYIPLHYSVHDGHSKFLYRQYNTTSDGMVLNDKPFVPFNHVDIQNDDDLYESLIEDIDNTIPHKYQVLADSIIFADLNPKIGGYALNQNKQMNFTIVLPTYITTSTIIHEYGHVVTMTRNHEHFTFAQMPLTAAFDERFDSSYNHTGISYVSDYAQTNIWEDMADTFEAFIFYDKPTSKDPVFYDKILFYYDYPQLVEMREDFRAMPHVVQYIKSMTTFDASTLDIFVVDDKDALVIDVLINQLVIDPAVIVTITLENNDTDQEYVYTSHLTGMHYDHMKVHNIIADVPPGDYTVYVELDGNEVEYDDVLHVPSSGLAYFE